MVKSDSESIVKTMLIDFNSAAFFTIGQTFATFDGTLHYAGPEAFGELEEDDGYDPQKYDLWGLGVCLYCLYFGKLPFDLTDDDDVYGYEIKMHMKIRKDPLSFANTPEPLKKVLQGLLTKDFRDRWGWDDLWRCELFGLLGLSVGVESSKSTG